MAATIITNTPRAGESAEQTAARNRRRERMPLVGPAPSAQSDNPKNLAARNRVKIALLPSAGVIHGAHACMNGADKYGPYNWREKKIALMEYASAIQRHVLDWVDGENLAPDSQCHHLGHIIASAAIMLDAIECGIAIDDRPKPGKAPEILTRLAG